MSGINLSAEQHVNESQAVTEPNTASVIAAAREAAPNLSKLLLTKEGEIDSDFVGKASKLQAALRKDARLALQCSFILEFKKSYVDAEGYNIASRWNTQEKANCVAKHQIRAGQEAIIATIKETYGVDVRFNDIMERDSSNSMTVEVKINDEFVPIARITEHADSIFVHYIPSAIADSNREGLNYDHVVRDILQFGSSIADTKRGGTFKVLDIGQSIVYPATAANVKRVNAHRTHISTKTIYNSRFMEIVNNLFNLVDRSVSIDAEEQPQQAKAKKSLFKKIKSLISAAIKAGERAANNRGTAKDKQIIHQGYFFGYANLQDIVLGNNIADATEAAVYSLDDSIDFVALENIDLTSWGDINANIRIELPKLQLNAVGMVKSGTFWSRVNRSKPSYQRVFAALSRGVVLPRDEATQKHVVGLILRGTKKVAGADRVLGLENFPQGAHIQLLAAANLLATVNGKLLAAQVSGSHVNRVTMRINAVTMQNNRNSLVEIYQARVEAGNIALQEQNSKPQQDTVDWQRNIAIINEILGATFQPTRDGNQEQAITNVPNLQDFIRFFTDDITVDAPVCTADNIAAHMAHLQKMEASLNRMCQIVDYAQNMQVKTSYKSRFLGSHKVANDAKKVKQFRKAVHALRAQFYASYDIAINLATEFQRVETTLVVEQEQGVQQGGHQRTGSLNARLHEEQEQEIVASEENDAEFESDNESQADDHESVASVDHEHRADSPSTVTSSSSSEHSAASSDESEEELPHFVAFIVEDENQQKHLAICAANDEDDDSFKGYVEGIDYDNNWRITYTTDSNETIDVDIFDIDFQKYGLAYEDGEPNFALIEEVFESSMQREEPVSTQDATPEQDNRVDSPTADRNETGQEAPQVSGTDNMVRPGQPSHNTPLASEEQPALQERRPQRGFLAEIEARGRIE